MPLQQEREIAVQSSLGDDALLLSTVHYTEELGRPFHMTLQVSLGKPEVNIYDAVGKPILVRMTMLNKKPRYFHGVVRGVTEPAQALSKRTFTLDVVPALALLALTTDSRIFPPDHTIKDIVNEVLKPYGVEPDWRIEGPTRKRKHCVQYRESDLNFVMRMCEQEGLTIFHEHLINTHSMVIANASAKFKKIPDYDTIDYHDPDSGLKHDGIGAWKLRSTMQTQSVAVADFDFKKPKAKLLSEKEVGFTHQLKGSEHYEHPGEFWERSEGDDIAKFIAESLHSQARVFYGDADCRAMTVGAKFKLKDSTAKLIKGMADQDYLITSISISGHNDEFTSGSNASSHVNTSFTAVLANQEFRPLRRTPKPIVAGPQTATVVGGEKEDVHVDPHGRVQVLFHWDRDHEAKPGASCWVRVSQLWAGKQWGSMFIPRVGHEVIVEFMDGDPDRPVITGRLYNEDNKPPYALPENKTVSTIKTDSSYDGKGNNELRFEDKKSSEQVLLQAQRRLDIFAKANMYETAGGSREEKVGKDNKGDHNILVANDTNWIVVGGRYEQVDKPLHQGVKEDVVEVYDKNQTTVVKEALTLNAKSIIQEGSQVISLKGGKVAIQGAQSASLKAGMVKIEGTQMISLKCGASFISITPSGVFISGPMVHINSGGSSQPADGPETAKDPTLEEPIEAASAMSALPGSHGGGKATPRTRKSRVVPLQRAPEPPPPPPQGPRILPPPGTDLNFIDIRWVERNTYCGGPATLEGTTRNYPNNTNENGEVRNVTDGAVIAGVVLTISGNSFSKPVDVKDWLPRRNGANYETEREEDGFAAGKKTPIPLKMKFIPSLTRIACAIGKSQFSVVVNNYECEVGGTIQYVKGFMAWIIQLDNHVPAATGGQAGVNWGAQVAGSFSGTDWRFCKDSTASPTGRVFWDGAAWQNVPATWTDPGNVKLYGLGIYREGATNKAQFGNNWPEDIPAWNAAQQGVADTTLPTWTTNTNNTWTNKFDLRRHGCVSTDQKCCRYSVKVVVSFASVATRSGHVIIIGVNDGRSNAGAWSLGDARPALAPHEFGHHLNCPDEYVGGVGIDPWNSDGDGLTGGIDPTSLMGSVPAGNIPPIKARHLKTIKQHLTDMIQTQKSVAWTFDTVAHV